MFGILAWMTRAAARPQRSRPPKPSALAGTGGDPAEDDHQRIQYIGNAEGLLEPAVAVRGAGSLARSHDVSRHINQFRLVGAAGDLEPLGHTVAIGIGARSGETQVAEDRVKLSTENKT